MPVIVAPLSDLSPAQIQHLERHFEKVNRGFRRKYLPSSKRERFLRSVRRTTRRMEHWTGPLTEDQRQRVAELRRAFPEINEDWLSYNADKQQRLLALLKNEAGPQALSDFLLGWWTALEGSSPSLRRKSEEALENMTRLLLEVDELLEISQRRFLLRRLDNYIQQIEELIAQQ